MKLINRFLFLSAALSIACSAKSPQVEAQTVLPGIDALRKRNFDVLAGKRIGLITNPTGVSADLTSTIDILNDAPQVKLTALFGPEHGVRGNIFAGKKIKDYVDERTGLPVYSLYGSTRKPTPEMLENIDVLVYDIQDIGSRAYTYIYTMAYAMQAAAEKGLQVVVLDRPNPLGAKLIEGPVLEEKFSSFIGLYPIPYIYGMTVGELAQYFNKEFNINADLTVVKMQGYRRNMTFEETGLQWVATSPHIPHAETAIFCATTGIIGELGKVSEGVGYTQPFEMICQEWIAPQAFAENLNRRNITGVHFRPVYIRPYYFSMKGKELGGVQIHITDPQEFSPMRAQLHIMAALIELYPEQNLFKTDRMSMFQKAMGTDKVHQALLAGTSPEQIMASWKTEIVRFKSKRQKYLLYK